MLFVFSLLLTISSVSALSLLKTYQLCTQMLNVQIVGLMAQNKLGWFCSNNIDKDEPVRIYNMESNTTIQVVKNKSELISTFSYASAAELLLIGTANSSLFLYEVHNNRIISTHRSPQNNVIIEGCSANLKNNMIGWAGSDGKLCIVNLYNNKSNCVLAHAFNVSAIQFNKFDNTIITCGGDRLCKQWRVQAADDTIILLRSFMLSKISKVARILISQKRIMTSGPEGFQSFPISTSNQISLVSGVPVVCGLLQQRWNTFLIVSPQGVLSITELSSGVVTAKYNLYEKVQSCSFYNMTTFVTGHPKGEVKIWQI